MDDYETCQSLDHNVHEANKQTLVRGLLQNYAYVVTQCISAGLPYRFYTCFSGVYIQMQQGTILIALSKHSNIQYITAES